MPGCFVKKPPRHKQEDANSDLTEKVPHGNNITLEPSTASFDDESIYDVPLSLPKRLEMINDRHDILSTVLLPENLEKNKTTPPVKPPRSPDRIRKKSPETQDELDFDRLPSPLPINIRESVNALLQRSSCGSETATSDIQMQENSATFDPFETYNTLNLEANVTNLSLPGPPSWDAADEDNPECMPSPPVFLNEITTTVTTSAKTDPYDKLSRDIGISTQVDSNSSLPENYPSSDESQEIYDAIDELAEQRSQPNATNQTTPYNLSAENLQVAPSRVPKYEEVTLFSGGTLETDLASLSYEKPIFKNDITSSSPNNETVEENHIEDVYSVAENISELALPTALKLKPEKMPLSAKSSTGSMASSVRRSQSFELYDAASESGTNTTRKCVLLCVVNALYHLL